MTNLSWDLFCVYRFGLCCSIYSLLSFSFPLPPPLGLAIPIPSCQRYSIPLPPSFLGDSTFPLSLRCHSLSLPSILGFTVPSPSTLPACLGTRCSLHPPCRCSRGCMVTEIISSHRTVCLERESLTRWSATFQRWEENYFLIQLEKRFPLLKTVHNKKG